MVKIGTGFVLLVVIFLMGCRTSFTTFFSATNTPSSHQKDISEFEQAEARGRLAYIAADGNVYVTTADRHSTIVVTDDATTRWEGIGLSYQRISWSPDGQLAYAAVTRSGNGATRPLRPGPNK